MSTVKRSSTTFFAMLAFGWVFHITGGRLRRCVVREGEEADQGTRQVLSAGEGGGRAKEKEE